MSTKEIASEVPDNERVRLGGKLREAREYLALSQEEVAKAVGIPRAAISMIESGKRGVDALELKRFATVYGRPVSHFTGEGHEESQIPDEIAHLARAARSLSQRDREELARFAEFLKSRAAKEGEDR